MEEINGIKIHCKYDALIDPKLLQDYSKNPNKHGQDQIERLGKVFKYTGVRHPIVFDKERNCIAAGHGRKLTAILIGMEKYPVVYQTFKDDDEFYAFVTADNALSDWSSLDLGEINSMLQNLGPDFDIDFLGIKDFSLDITDDGFNPLDDSNDKEPKRCPHCQEII